MYNRHEMLDVVKVEGKARGIIARNLVTGKIERHSAHAVVLATDEKFKRPAEVDLLIGDSTKAREQLGWKPKYDLDIVGNVKISGTIVDGADGTGSSGELLV